MKNQHRVSNLFYNNKFVAVFSVIAALIIWAVVTIEKTPETVVTVKDIPVSVDYKGLESKLGLTAFGDTEFTVSVTIKGQKFMVEDKNIKDSITASAYTGMVTGSGNNSLSIDVQSQNDAITIESVSPSVINVYLDYPSEKEFNIEPIIENKDNIVPDGYVLGEPYFSESSVIKVKGPEFEINKIKGIKAYISVDGPVTDTQIITTTLAPDIEDTVNNKYISYTRGKSSTEVSEVTITLPVYKQIDLGTSVSFTGKPASAGNPSYTISPSKVSVGVPEGRVNSINSLSVAKIDYSLLKPGKNEFTFKASDVETSGVVILDDVQEFTVTVNVDGVSTKTIDSPEWLTVTGVPEGVNVTTATPDFAEIVIVGPSDKINSITTDNIVMAADLSEIDTEDSSPQTVSVLFGDDYCWLNGEYTATITIE